MDEDPDTPMGTIFDRLKDKVLVKRPVLKNILKKKGHKNLLEYIKEYIDVNLNPTIPKRQHDILETIFEVVEARFGKKTAWSVFRQLEKHYFVSTADHTGPLTHPFFVNSNLLIAASLFQKRSKTLKNIIVLTCAKVAYDNSSFPRGWLFHSNHTNQLNLQRLSFLNSNPKPEVMYCMPPFTRENIQKAKDSLKTKLKNKDIDQREYDVMNNIINTIYENPDVLESKDYCEQMSKTNYHLWKKFFETSNVKLPNLIQLELEDIVTKLIIKYHLYQDTIINHILFDSNYERYLNSYFEGIYGSFSRQESSGTYLFWGLPKGQHKMIQLWKKDNYLVSKDGSYKIELAPEVIKKAMESKELIPSLLLSFATVSFYYGLKCLGGFNQVNYLTLMKNAYIKMNVDLGNYRSIEVCARAQTKEICDGLTAAFLHDHNGKLMLATGIDLILYGDKNSWTRFMDTARQITLSEALSPIMPEIYRISYDSKEWEQNLLNITDKDINQLTGLDKKIKPCITI